MEQKLKDQWISLWHSNVRMMSVCRNHATFKCLFGRKKLKTKSGIGLTKKKNKKKLPVAIGRYQNVSREERICDKCDGRALGDDYHAILVCSN